MECYTKLQALEQNRQFCGHTMEHFLDVARLMYIFSLESGMADNKALIYAAALLHDIGRYQEYMDGTEHHAASGAVASEILPACGFSDQECRIIVRGILNHRNTENKDIFSKLLYRADKMSRRCYACSVSDACNWPEEKKNLTIIY